VDVAEEGAHLIQLARVGPENFGRTREVVYYGDGQDFDAHLLFDLASGSLIFVGIVEFRDGVVVFVGVFPPLRAELANIRKGVFLDEVS